MAISLREITKANWQRVAELSVSEDQRRFVASNAYSIAESAFCESCVARAIYSGEKPVGFLMYESLERCGLPNEYSIYRFMVDKNAQGGGIGRKALKLLIDTLLDIEDTKRITICYIPGNEVARDFYASLGFTEVGVDASGEMIAEIRVEN